MNTYKTIYQTFKKTETANYNGIDFNYDIEISRWVNDNKPQDTHPLSHINILVKSITRNTLNELTGYNSTPSQFYTREIRIDTLTPPSKLINDYLEKEKMSKEEFALKLNEPLEKVEALLNGEYQIQDEGKNDIASKLAETIGKTKWFWIEQNNNYEQNKNHFKEEKAFVKQNIEKNEKILSVSERGTKSYRKALMKRDVNERILVFLELIETLRDDIIKKYPYKIDYEENCYETLAKKGFKIENLTYDSANYFSEPNKFNVYTKYSPKDDKIIESLRLKTNYIENKEITFTCEAYTTDKNDFKITWLKGENKTEDFEKILFLKDSNREEMIKDFKWNFPEFDIDKMKEALTKLYNKKELVESLGSIKTECRAIMESIVENYKKGAEYRAKIEDMLRDGALDDPEHVKSLNENEFEQLVDYWVDNYDDDSNYDNVENDSFDECE